jgi:hypothetical protein
MANCRHTPSHTQHNFVEIRYNRLERSFTTSFGLVGHHQVPAAVLSASRERVRLFWWLCTPVLFDGVSFRLCGLVVIVPGR